MHFVERVLYLIYENHWPGNVGFLNVGFNKWTQTTLSLPYIGSCNFHMSMVLKSVDCACEKLSLHLKILETVTRNVYLFLMTVGLLSFRIFMLQCSLRTIFILSFFDDVWRNERKWVHKTHNIIYCISL